MRRAMTAFFLIFAILAPAACGSDGPADGVTADGGVAGGGVATDDGVAAGPGAGADTVPSCPFTAAKVSDLVGQTMVDEGNCMFGDGKGVAIRTITMSSASTGEITYAYERDQAGKIFTQLSDIQKGRKAYLAIKDIGAEATLISDRGAYAVSMSSFSFDTATYDRTMRALIDAILA